MRTNQDTADQLLTTGGSAAPPRRKMRWGRVDVRRYVYFIGAEGGPVKIGSAIEPVDRRKELQTGNPEYLWFWAFCEGDHDLERAYHRRFASSRVRGEWFARTPDLEAEMERLCRALQFTTEDAHVDG